MAKFIVQKAKNTRGAKYVRLFIDFSLLKK